MPIPLLENINAQMIQNHLKKCAQNCRRSIKNGPNYRQAVSVCTKQCHIRILSKFVAQLRNSGNKTQLRYFQNRLALATSKLKTSKSVLRKRETKVPVNLSLKPSPERYNPRKIQ